MAGNSTGSINLNKVLFDEKNFLGSENINKAQFIVLDGASVVDQTQAGLVIHPVRKMTAEQLKAWVASGSTQSSNMTFRAQGQVAGLNAVSFVTIIDSETMQSLGISQDNVAAIEAHIVGKTVSSTPNQFASFRWHYCGSPVDTYLTDVVVPAIDTEHPDNSIFVSPHNTEIDALTFSVEYGESAATLKVMGLNPDQAEVKWAAYITFYPVETNIGSDDGGPEV